MTSQDEENAINSNTSPRAALQDHAGSSVNDSGTCTEIGTPLTQQRSVFGPSRLLDHMARDLYRAIPTMPRPARRFAYNLIELIYSDAMFRAPMGDHPLQQPRLLFERQMVRLEEAMVTA